MTRHKCIPNTINLKCTGTTEGTTCKLKVTYQSVKVHSEALGLATDKVFPGFGTCNLASDKTCKPKPGNWINLSDPTVKSNGEQLLTGNSKLPCETAPGIISIEIDSPTPPVPEDSWFGSLGKKLKGFESTLKSPLKSVAKAFGESDFGKTVIDTVGETTSNVLDTYNEVKDTALKAAASVGLENELQLVIDIEEGLVRQATRYATKAADFVVESVDGMASAAYDETQAGFVALDEIVESENPYETMRQMASENYAENSKSFNEFLQAAEMSYDQFMEDPDGNLLKMYEDKKLATTDWIERYNNSSTQERQDMGVDGIIAGAKVLLDKKGQFKDIKDKISDLGGAAKRMAKGGKSEVNVASNAKQELPKGGNNDKSKTNPDGTTNNPDSEKAKEQAKGDPVDVVTGTVINDYVDFEIPGIIPIEWKRNWYSDSKYKGPLGHGCHHSYDIRLKQRSKDLLLTLPDGRPAFFPILTQTNSTNYNRAEKLTLSLLENKNYQLFDHKKQLSYSLEYRSGMYRPTKLFNADGITIHFQYINTRLHRIIDTANRLIKIDSDDNDRITKITLHHKSKEKTLINYGYNDAGDMILMTDALGQSTRAVYKNHLMVSKTDRNGQTYYWEYDGTSFGSKCIHTWGDGGLLDYTIEYGRKYNTVTNSLGHQSLFYYEGNLATKIVDPLGGEISKEYDEDQNLIKYTDEENNETHYDYDDKGNIVEIKYPDQASVGYAFDEKGRLQLKTLPEGGNLIKSYKKERLDCVITPDGMMTTFEYNEKGLITTVFDNQDNETQLFYDDDQNLTQLKLPNGAISTWEYDEWGQCIAAINPEKHKQQFHYDILGRVTQVQLPDNNNIQLKYNGYEQVVEAIDDQRKIKFEYTPVGSLKTREENGKKVLFTYNKEDQLTGVINRKGEVYRFTRDAKGNISREQGYDDITRHFQRDKAGKVFKVDRPGEKHSVYEYDKGGRISRIEHHDGTWATYSYNKDGLLVEAINPNSHVKFNRDESGRILSENQDGHIVSSEYGELGVRSGIKSSLGANISFEHSAIGEGTKTVAKTGKSKPWEASYKYNSLGMETERIISGGVTSSWAYDEAGRPLQQRVNNQKGEQRNRSYAWDVNNKLKKIKDNLKGGTVGFTYDAFNNLATVQYEDGSYDYKLPDEVGNLYRTKSKNDKTYGKSGQLQQSGSTTYNYDDEGNLIEKNTPKGVWKYTWEAGGMLKSVLKPDRTQITMEYDALGRRTAKIIPLTPKRGTITRFIWDGNVPLHEWQYDLRDRPNTIVDELGKIKKDKKEPLGFSPSGGDVRRTEGDLITWVFDQGTFKPAAKITEKDNYSIITDYLGTPIEMYNSKGEKTWEVEYDIYGKIRKQVHGKPADCPFRYKGQYEDVETGLYYNRFRYYNAEDGVYISQDPIRLKGNNPNIYGYTHDSNSLVDVFGLSEGNIKKENDDRFTDEELDGRYNGNVNWPENDGFDGPTENITLEPGTTIDRYGGTGGTFVSPEGVPFGDRSLAPGSEFKDYNVYEVVKPIDGIGGKVAPSFGEPGGGDQYKLNNSIQDLLDGGYIEVKEE